MKKLIAVLVLIVLIALSQTSCLTTATAPPDAYDTLRTTDR
jgi:predicted small secreted protein